MPLMPERVKYRKMQRGHRTGIATRCNTVAFGEYGLQALERCWMDTKQIEAALANAARVRDLDGGLTDLLWSFAPDPPGPAPRTLADVPAVTPESTAMAKELKRRGLRLNYA